MSSSVVDESTVGDPQGGVAAGDQEEDVDQEVVSEMVAFNAEEVADVEGFEEWADQEEEEQEEGHDDDDEDIEQTTRAVVSHDGQHQHHIIEGAVMLSTGGQVLLVDAEGVDGRVFTRSSAASAGGLVLSGTPAAHTFSCTLCNMGFPSKSALVAHQRREHPNAVVTASASPVASPPTGTVSAAAGAAGASGNASSEAARRSHICSMCNKGFTTSSNLHQHRRLHFNERPFQCNQCNKGFATSTNLKQHYRTHTGDRPYPCMYCPKRFATNSNLRQHIRTHTAEIIAETAINAQVRNQPDGTESWEVDGASAVSLSLIPAICLQQYVCNICNKVYSNSSNLAQHKRTIHPKDFVRRYLCTFCNKTFSLITNLRRHQKRTCPNVKHEPGTEPSESWPCEECGKVCSTKGNLKSHKVTHLGIKLFECFICEKRFTTNSNLKQHLIVHDGKYNGHQTKRKRGSAAASASVAVSSPEERRVKPSRSESTASTGFQLPSAKFSSGAASATAATTATTTTVTNSNETSAAVRHLQEVEVESFVAGESNAVSFSADEHMVVIAEEEPDHNETESASTLNNAVVSTADVDGVGTVTLATEQQLQEQHQQLHVVTPPGGGTVARTAITIGGGETIPRSTASVTYATAPVTAPAAVTRLTKRPVIIKLDVDRDTKPSPVSPANSAMAQHCGVMIRAPPVRQPVLLPPPPLKGHATVSGGQSTSAGLIGANSLIRTGVARRL